MMMIFPNFQAPMDLEIKIKAQLTCHLVNIDFNRHTRYGLVESLRANKHKIILNKISNVLPHFLHASSFGKFIVTLYDPMIYNRQQIFMCSKKVLSRCGKMRLTGSVESG